MLWIGTDGGGVAVTDLAPALFSGLTSRHLGGRPFFITCISREASGSVLAGTLDGELLRGP
jgi:hypothetical protein